jgi:hypothetical protein
VALASQNEIEFPILGILALAYDISTFEGEREGHFPFMQPEGLLRENGAGCDLIPAPILCAKTKHGKQLTRGN